MTTKLSIAVPESTTSLFIVVSDKPIGAPPTTDTTVCVWRAADSPFDLCSVWTYENWDDPVPPPSAYHIIVSKTANVREQPRAAQLTRATARSIATQADGLLIDWATRDVLLNTDRPERARFHLGNQWLGFDFHLYAERHDGIPEREPWSLDPPGPADACAANRITTRGLARFGLPELVLDDLDCEHHLVGTNVLRAAAQHLLALHWTWLQDGGSGPGPTVRRLATRQQISGAAFADFWATRLMRDSPLTVSLTKRDGDLHIGSPDGTALNAWLADIDTDLRFVAGSPPDDFDHYESLAMSAT
jgi:hypothetical protein